MPPNLWPPRTAKPSSACVATACARPLPRTACLCAQTAASSIWLITGLKEQERRDLLEVIEDRTERASTLIATQLPVKDWHAAIGEPTLADAICDRLIHRAHRIDISGPSQRERRARGDHKAKKAELD